MGATCYWGGLWGQDMGFMVNKWGVSGVVMTRKPDVRREATEAFLISVEFPQKLGLHQR